MKKNPLVSVILPTYNRASLLPRAIKSVVNQTYNNFELIIIDDNSSDNTKEIVKNFEDKRIKYIRHKENKGGAAARNTGIELAKGEYIAFQDSDDEWLPQKLEKQVKVFRKLPQKFGVVYSGYWQLKNGQKKYLPSSKIHPREGNLADILLKGNFITTQTAIVRKDCLINSGMFDGTLPRLQDWELWIRISQHSFFKYINEPMVVTYFGHQSISSDKDAHLKALIIFVKKHGKNLKNNRKLFASYYFSISNSFFLKKEFKKGKEYLAKALKKNPFSVRLILVASITFFVPSWYVSVLRFFRLKRARE